MRANRKIKRSNSIVVPVYIRPLGIQLFFLSLCKQKHSWSMLSNRIFRFLTIFVSALPLFASTIEYPNSTPDAVLAVQENTFKRLGIQTFPREEMDGFLYHYSPGFFSPFPVHSYIGTFGGLTVLRIEGSPGQEKVFREIFESQLNPDSTLYSKSYGKKIPGIGPLLTLVSPALGHIYAYSYSPFGNTLQTALSATSLLLTDAMLFWVGSKTFFTHSIDPFDRGLIATSILMGGFRVASLYYNFRAEERHNRVVEAGFRFSY